MALVEHKCPECGAMFKVDDEREYGFCTYCGAQIRTKEEVIEVRYSGEILVTDAEPLENLISEGNTFLNLGNFYQAEQKFYRALEAYPDCPQGYERLVCAITRNYTVYVVGNAHRACELMEKMVAVAPPREKERYRQLQQKVVDAYMRAYDEKPLNYDALELSRLNKAIVQMLLLFIGCTIFVIYCITSPEKDPVITMAEIIFGGFGVFAAFIFVVCYRQRRELLQKMREKNGL